MKMTKKSENLRLLSRACRILLDDYNDFWVLACLTEASFEEGVRNSRFNRFVRAYEAKGISSHLIDQLKGGTNGNLKRILENENIQIGRVMRTVGKGQDLSWDAWALGNSARIEIKVVSDTTMLKYFPNVAADLEKLGRVRVQHPNCDLFLVVFFTQLPQYDYPSGQFRSTGKRSLTRSTYLHYRTILEQFHQLSILIKEKPVWPAHYPHRITLAAPIPSIIKAAAQSLMDGWVADANWKFEPKVHLSDAAASAMIWQV